MSIKYLLISLALLLSTFATAQELVFEKIEGVNFQNPVDIASTNVQFDERLFIVEKSGKIFVLTDPQGPTTTKLVDPMLDLSGVVDDNFEGGLLGLAFHPEFASNGYFFVNYTFEDPENGNQFSTRVSRFTMDINNLNVALPDSEVPVITIPQPKKNHNGGDIAFGPDGFLYIPLGDGGGAGDQFKTAQDRQSLLGKNLRIDVNTLPYTIPSDNPFAEDDFTLDEIWAIGLRNPWRFSFDRETGDMWIGDVGQNEIEEINMEPVGDTGGRNYGWNCFEGSQEYNNEQCPDGISHTFPVFEYDQSQGWKSVTGGYVYRGTRHPDLVGKYIFTDYEDSRVFWLTTQENDGSFSTKRYNFSGSGHPSQITTFGESTDGEIFFATLIDGEIWRVATTVVISNQELKSMDLSISPNPVKDILLINSSEQLQNEAQIFNLAGQLVASFQPSNNSIDVSHLASGQYLLKIETDKGISQVRFIKK